MSKQCQEWIERMQTKLKQAFIDCEIIKKGPSCPNDHLYGQQIRDFQDLTREIARMAGGL